MGVQLKFGINTGVTKIGYATVAVALKKFKIGDPVIDSTGNKFLGTDVDGNLVEYVRVISSMTDVDTVTTEPTNGQALVYSTSESKWIPGTIDPTVSIGESISGAAGSKLLGTSALGNLIEYDRVISSMTDVDTISTPPTNGQSLVYSTGDSSWIPGTIDTTLNIGDTVGSSVANKLLAVDGSNNLIHVNMYYSGNNIGFNVAVPTAIIDAVAVSPTNVVSRFKGAPSQSANLTEWRDSSDVLLAHVSSGGSIHAKQGSGSNEGFQIGDGSYGRFYYDSSNKGTTIKAAEGGTQMVSVLLTTTSVKSRGFGVYNSSYTPYFYVGGDGYVGVGTATPISPLQVVTSTSTTGITIDAEATLTDYTALRWGTTAKFFSKEGGNMFIRMSEGITFVDGLSSRMRIDTSGKLGLLNGTPIGRIDVQSGGISEVALIVRGAASQSSNIIQYWNSSSVVMGGVDNNGVHYSYGKGNISTNLVYGSSAFISNTTGYQNTSMGAQALYYNTTGNDQVAIGYRALYNVVGGAGRNIAIGSNAGSRYGAGIDMTSVEDSIFIGRYSQAGGNAQTNQIVIGNNVTGNGSNSVTIGNSSNTWNYFTGGATFTGTSDFIFNTSNGSVIVGGATVLRKLSAKLQWGQSSSITEQLFYTSNTERLTIDSVGRIGVNKTSSIGSRLHVVSSSPTEKSAIFQGAASQTENLTEWHDSTSVVMAYVTSNGSIVAPSFNGTSGYFGVTTARLQLNTAASTNRSIIKAVGDGIFAITDSSEADFNRLQFGGTTTSYPSLKRSTNMLQSRLADDSAYAGFVGSNIWADNGTSGSPSFATGSRIAGIYEPSYANLGFNSFGGEAGRIESSSRLWQLGGTGGAAKLNVFSGSPTMIGTIVKGAVSQTSNLSEWRNNSGTTLAYVSAGGNVAGSLIISTGDRLRITTSHTPSSASDTGTTGDICWDSSYIYVCIATNTWLRGAISTW